MEGVRDALEQHGCWSRDGKTWTCPAHEDGHPSLSVSEGQEGVVMYCQAGCDTGQVLAELDLTFADLFPKAEAPRNGSGLGQRIATYPYTDERGLVLFEVIRYEGKEFRQRRKATPADPPDKIRKGGWVWSLNGTRRVLYRLPKVLQAVQDGQPVWVAEGEKDVHALERAGVTATCNPGGAGKWSGDYARHLAGAEVMIVADQDEPGREHAQAVKASLEAVRASARIVFPAVGKDAADHLTAGHGLDEFVPLEPPPPPAPVPVDPPALGDFNAARYGAALKAVGHLRLGLDGQLWRYVDGVYRPTGDAWLRAESRRKLGEQFTARRRKDIEDWCRAEEPTVGVRADRDTVNVANGLLDWRTGELRPHTPEHVSTIQLPVTFDPQASCPAVLEFMGQVLPADAVDFALEIAGLLLVPDARFRKAVLLVGSGRNGKSTLLSLIRRLIGPGNVSSRPLQDFGEDRYATADVYGKLANICGDLDARALRRSDTFKLLVGGTDELVAQHKYARAFEFMPFARLLFSANEAPATTDQTDAYFDRWLVVPFPRRFSEAEADPGLLDRLTTDRELSGLLNLALAGLRSLQARGHFVPPASVHEAADEYREQTDTVAGFIEDQCQLSAGAWVGKAELYRAYRSWCDGSNRYAISAQRFNQKLVTRPDIDQTKHGGDRRWVGIGLAVSEPGQEPAPWAS
jgi:putative DNA primase/helicase